MRENSKALWEVFLKYTNLQIGGKEVVCPYWMDKQKLGIFGFLGGKGTPEQIIRSVEKEAENSRVNLSNLSVKEIVSFMKSKKIGVDCSGFVYWALDAFDRERGGNGIRDDIPGSCGRFVKERASVKMFVSASREIKEMSKIRAGDLLVNKNENHIAVVLSVIRNKSGYPVEIKYAHSKKPTGVCSAIITDWKNNSDFTKVFRLKSLD